MGEINSTMPKKASKKKRDESADPFIKAIESEDKEGLSKEPPQDHPCSVPRASRVAICAPPGHGKSCLAKHIAVYSRPFAAVYVIHGAGAATREWEKVQHTMTNFTQATAEYWAAQSKLHGGEPLLCICDDLNWQDLSPKERTNAYKLVQFVCTHHCVTALMCCHSWVGLTARMRRACDIVCLWPPTLGGADQTSYIARSIGIGKLELEAAFDQCRTKYECVCIYTDPPPGRSTFMINMSRPFDPHAAVDGYEDYGYH
jgi:hypothetical protein